MGARLPTGVLAGRGRGEGGTGAWVLMELTSVSSHPSAWSCTAGDPTCPICLPPRNASSRRVAGPALSTLGPSPWHTAWPPLGMKETGEPVPASVLHLTALGSLCVAA